MVSIGVLVFTCGGARKRKGTMTNEEQKADVQETVGFLSEILRQGALIWRLMRSGDVPGWVKFIPPLAILYLLMPIDIVPDPVLGFGQLDDLAVVLLSLKLFVELCPPGVVQRLRDDLRGSTPPQPEQDVVDASYRVIDE
jgi:uncharacterized membrane protein YkvA (DUF1232 family)